VRAVVFFAVAAAAAPSGGQAAEWIRGLPGARGV